MSTSIPCTDGFWKFDRHAFVNGTKEVRFSVSRHGTKVASIGGDNFTPMLDMVFYWNDLTPVERDDFFLTAARLYVSDEMSWCITGAEVYGRNHRLICRVNIKGKYISEGGSAVKTALLLKEVRAFAFATDCTDDELFNEFGLSLDGTVIGVYRLNGRQIG